MVYSILILLSLYFLALGWIQQCYGMKAGVEDDPQVDWTCLALAVGGEKVNSSLHLKAFYQKVFSGQQGLELWV